MSDKCLNRRIDAPIYMYNKSQNRSLIEVFPTDIVPISALKNVEHNPGRYYERLSHSFFRIWSFLASNFQNKSIFAFKQ